MRLEWNIAFLPAALTAVTDVLAAGFVLAHQPDYPTRFVAFQIVMLAAALLAAAPQIRIRCIGFLIVLAGVCISGMSVGMLYIPTAVAAGWAMARGPDARKQE